MTKIQNGHGLLSNLMLGDLSKLSVKYGVVVAIITASNLVSCTLPSPPKITKSPAPTTTPSVVPTESVASSPIVSPPILPPAPSITPIITKPFLPPSESIEAPPTATPSIPPTPPSVASNLPYEEQAQAKAGWKTVKTFRGSGMTNFCATTGDTFTAKAPWRVRWRVSQVTNTKSGNGSMSIEIISKTSTKNLPILESGEVLTESVSEILEPNDNLCFLARSRSTKYTILVEEQSKSKSVFSQNN
jgi:hypothetical protein